MTSEWRHDFDVNQYTYYKNKNEFKGGYVLDLPQNEMSGGRGIGEGSDKGIEYDKKRKPSFAIPAGLVIHSSVVEETPFYRFEMIKIEKGVVPNMLFDRLFQLASVKNGKLSSESSTRKHLSSNVSHKTKKIKI